jgi:hypothetical protein
MSGRNLLLLLVLMSLAVLSGCSGGAPGRLAPTPPSTQGQVAITEGVWGNVWLWEGDSMPGTSGNGITITPVVREVLIYEPTNMSSCVPGPPGFIREITTKLVATTTSNATGFFQVSLPPGTYSVFVKEGSLYVWTGPDGNGILHPVTVVPGSVTKTQLDIRRDSS